MQQRQNVKYFYRKLYIVIIFVVKFIVKFRS